MTAVDNELKCNNIRCRAQLGLQGQAVVTICSHAFCLECANRDIIGGRPCPACQTPLLDEDDVVISCLSPSSGYKYTILAGMTPGLIIEIAAKALAFWTYQTTTESELQSIALNKSNTRLEEARQTNGGMQHELARAHRSLKEFENQLNLEKRRSHGFEQALKEKDRELLKMKGMSDNMMKRAVLGNAAQNEMLRNVGNPSPLDSGRNYDQRRMMSGTPIPSNGQHPLRSTPLKAQNQAPRSGPFFYPKLSTTTAAYTSRATPTFHLHPTNNGQPQGSAVRQRIARDVEYGGQGHGQGQGQERQRSGQGGSEISGEDGRRLRSRQATGPAYFGAP